MKTHTVFPKTFAFKTTTFIAWHIVSFTHVHKTILTF
jgi:hypothetical protein